MPLNFSLSTQSFSFIIDKFLSLPSAYKDSNTNLKIKYLNYFEVVDYIIRKNGDTGIISISDNHIDLWGKLFTSKNIEFNSIMSGELKGYMLDSHPLYNKNNLTLNDLFDYPLVTCNHDDYNCLYSNEIYKDTLSFKIIY